MRPGPVISFTNCTGLPLPGEGVWLFESCAEGVRRLAEVVCRLDFRDARQPGVVLLRLILCPDRPR